MPRSVGSNAVDAILQKSLAAVAGCGNPALATAAERMAALAARRGMEALSFAPDRDRLSEEVKNIAARKHFNGISVLTP